MATEQAYDYSFKVLLVGNSGTGKSSLLLRYADDAFTDEYFSTIGVDFKKKTLRHDGKTIKLVLWDTAGQERFRNITLSYYRGAHGYLLVFDITDRSSFENADYWLSDISKGRSASCPTLLVGNKCDLECKRAVTREEATSFAVINNMQYIETSASSSENVEEAFLDLLSEMRQNISQPADNPHLSAPECKQGNKSSDDVVGVVVSNDETVASVCAANDIPEWAVQVIEELESLNDKMKVFSSLEDTVKSLVKRVDNLETKMTRIESKAASTSKKIDFKTAQSKSKTQFS